MANNSTSKQAYKWRPWLIVTAIILIIISSLSFFATNNIYNSTTFAKKTTSAVTSETARNAIANQVTSEILDNQSPVVRRVLTQPITTVVSTLLTTDAFSDVVYNFSYGLNQFFTTKDFEPITIDLSSAASTIETIADKIKPDNTLDLSRLDQPIELLDNTNLPPFKTIGQTLLITGPLALLAVLALAIASLVKRKDKWEFAKDSSIVLGASSVALYILTYTSGALITISVIDPEKSTLMQEIYNVFVHDFRNMLFVMFLVSIALYGAYYFKKNKVNLLVNRSK